MAKLFSKTRIIRMKDGREEVIEPRKVFEATPAEAKQFDKLNAARPATAAEINGEAESKVEVASEKPTHEESTTAMPDSGANGDPKSSPKGKSA